MATANGLPPMGKIHLIGKWIETLLYGVNCIMYALCMLVLLRKSKAPTQRWVLAVLSTILFLLATAHVGASLQQLLDAFVYGPADEPDYSTTYWFQFNDVTLRSLKSNLYDALVFFQDLTIIWRLYVVFMYDWRVIVIPIIIDLASVALAFAATAISVQQDVGPFGSIVPDLSISAWVINIAFNVSVTVAIAWRLWWMGRKTASLTSTKTNHYGFAIYVVVESGAIFAGANIIALVLYALSSPLTAIGIDVAAQLATLTPLLIVVQVGVTGRHRFLGEETSSTVPTGQGETAFQVEIPAGSLQDLPHHATLEHPRGCQCDRCRLSPVTSHTEEESTDEVKV